MSLLSVLLLSFKFGELFSQLFGPSLAVLNSVLHLFYLFMEPTLLEEVLIDKVFEHDFAVAIVIHLLEHVVDDVGDTRQNLALSSWDFA